MKKIIFLAGLLAVTLVSCKKNNDDDDSGSGGGPSATIPTTFTQKVLLEEFTGAWCGYCPRGAATSETLETSKAGKFIPVAVHSGDVMEITYGAFIDNLFNTVGYPSGMINRTAVNGEAALGDNLWSSKTTAILNETATAGLAIDASKVTGETMTLKVRTSITLTDTGQFKLIVYLVEKSVINSASTYDQHNYMSQTGSSPDPSSPYYDDPPLIHNFEHKHVLREVITAGNYGEDIPAAEIGAGIEHTVTYTVDLTGYTHSNLEVVAFIDKYSTDKAKHKVLNVQTTNVGSNKNYD
jgi:hypothetical protein